MAGVDFFSYQARKMRVDKPDAEPTASIPEIKVEELEQRPGAIEVEESTPSDTFIGRLRADIRKLWDR
jgi:hypothetical protein